MPTGPTETGYGRAAQSRRRRLLRQRPEPSRGERESQVNRREGWVVVVKPALGPKATPPPPDRKKRTPTPPATSSSPPCSGPDPQFLTPRGWAASPSRILASLPRPDSAPEPAPPLSPRLPQVCSTRTHPGATSGAERVRLRPLLSNPAGVTVTRASVCVSDSRPLFRCGDPIPQTEQSLGQLLEKTFAF